jgi:hypothetical protein
MSWVDEVVANHRLDSVEKDFEGFTAVCSCFDPDWDGDVFRSTGGAFTASLVSDAVWEWTLHLMDEVHTKEDDPVVDESLAYDRNNYKHPEWVALIV